MNFATKLQTKSMNWNQILNFPNLIKFPTGNYFAPYKLPFYEPSYFSLLTWNRQTGELYTSKCNNIDFQEFYLFDRKSYLLLNSDSEGCRLLFEISVLENGKLSIEEVKKEEYVESPMVTIDGY